MALALFGSLRTIHSTFSVQGGQLASVLEINLDCVTIVDDIVHVRVMGHSEGAVAVRHGEAL